MGTMTDRMHARGSLRNRFKASPAARDLTHIRPNPATALLQTRHSDRKRPAPNPRYCPMLARRPQCPKFKALLVGLISVMVVRCPPISNAGDIQASANYALCD